MSDRPSRERSSSPEEDKRPHKIPALRQASSAGSAGPDRPSSSSSQRRGDDESAAGEQTGASAVARGRGGYRPTTELRTIPKTVEGKDLSGDGGRSVSLLTNFVKISPGADSHMYQYRIDFVPNVESVKLRRHLIRGIETDHFQDKIIYDGSQEAKSLIKLDQEETSFPAQNPADQSDLVIKVKYTGSIEMGSFEMLRMYNTSMRQFMIYMGFYQMRRDFFHNNFHKELPGNHGISSVGGFRTSTNRHAAGLLLNLDTVNKYMQNMSCLQVLRNIHRAARQNQQDFRDAARAELSNKVVITRYNNKTYKIEDILFELNPERTFFDKRLNADSSYIDYYRRTYPELNISDRGQPLLLALPDRRPGTAQLAVQQAGDRPADAIHLIPELCFVTGLTPTQKDDNRLKMDMIRHSQVAPEDRVKSLRQFLKHFHANDRIRDRCKKWDINYADDVLTTQGRCLEPEAICWGNHRGQPEQRWFKCQPPGNFDRSVRDSKMYQPVHIKKLNVVIAKPNSNVYNTATKRIPDMLRALGVKIDDVSDTKMPDGRAGTFAHACKERVSPDTDMVLVVLPSKSKDIYDAVKKTLTKERGLPSQCVTAQLLADERKGASACQKIAIQMACKVGGEPWILSIPVKRAMICGYDTYHDTSKRGRSVGAFVASTNETYSRWWSKTDMHDQLEELSSNLATNVMEACQKFKIINGAPPERIIIYRDGVSEGQLEHVYNVELRNIKRSLSQIGTEIKLSVIIVTKRVGARFFALSQPIGNPQPGTVIDKDVVREGRFEFYLISQSTRQGTVAPTHYNIIEDYSGFQPKHHQMLAYKLCHLYYNWTGTVRVPAPCQYAHKLAQLVGEHIHSAPHTNLDNLLHYL